MERFTATKVRRLEIGDRFYKTKDRSKKVYEMVEGEVKQTFFKTYGFFCKADGETEAKAIDGKTDVIFLRKNEHVQPREKKRGLGRPAYYFND